MFEAVFNKISFPKLEENILSFWKKENIFEKSLELRKNAKPYIFYDGPPFATGLPHYGHLLASTIKDIVPRYQTMRGRYVERRFGWDCHGLPVEMEMQKTLKLEKNKDICDYGIERFNNACESIVLRHTEQWRQTIERIGRWVDFDNQYKTMDRSFIESVWWVFKTLFEKGLIYEGYKVVPYSWAAGSILSNFEANLAYQNTEDPSVVVKLPIKDEKDTFILAWTTMPWTLTANLALCVHPENIYVKIHDKKENIFYILGENPSKKYFKQEEIEIVERKKGKELANLKYQSIFNFADEEVDSKDIYRVICDDYVSDQDGTGVVHMAPAFGEDDFRITRKWGLPHYDPVDEDGNFIEKLPLVGGMNIKKADKFIIRFLKEKKLLFRQDTIKHSYPFCWRTDKPLIYKAFSSWFVRVEKIKDNLVESNKKINWVPEHIQKGRFGKWLENARDWAISRNRFWGAPIPIWKAEDGSILCIGSAAELEKLCGQKVEDLHKHSVDKLVIQHEGKDYHRVSEVLDCWFESGSMPYAQQHYPFENKEGFLKNFPADFIAEGLDQTRGWFYTLLTIGCALFEKSPFQNVIVNGLILAEDGKKMSKRLKNYPDPQKIFDTHGADALRMYFVSSPAVRGEILRFSQQGLDEIIKTILLPLWNAFSFFVTYANIDKWSPEKLYPAKEKLDCWIFSVFQSLVQKVEKSMESYEIYRAIPEIVNFVDLLTNVYIRRSRRRFWKSENDEDKVTAYSVFYIILKDFSKVLAPFAPFISEKIYRTLRKEDEPISVHHCLFPVMEEKSVCKKLEEEIETVNTIISLGRAARTQKKIKIRQPLQDLIVVSKKQVIEQYLKDNKTMICEELNVKNILLEKEESRYVDYTAKANFKTLGKKIGKKVKEVNKILLQTKSEKLAKIQENGGILIALGDGEKISLSLEDIDIRRIEKDEQKMARAGEISCLINSKIDENLLLEGMAREFVHAVQRQRKEENLHYTDRIKIVYKSTEQVDEALEKNKQYITKETLCCELKKLKTSHNRFQCVDIERQECFFYIVRR